MLSLLGVPTSPPRKGDPEFLRQGQSAMLPPTTTCHIFQNGEGWWSRAKQVWEERERNMKISHREKPA